MSTAKSRLLRIFLASLTVTALFAAMLPSVASAHERRTVGDYEFVVGWAVEPAFEGLKNAAQLRVTGVATSAPVEGLQSTLQVEITYVSTGQSVTKPLRAIFGDPGHYQADMIATQPGDYSFRFFGTIDGMDVNETFTSGEGTFNRMLPTTEIQFPDAVASAREMEGVVRAAQDRAADAEAAAANARTMAFVGIAVGAVGLVVGAGGIAMRRR